MMIGLTQTYFYKLENGVEDKTVLYSYAALSQNNLTNVTIPSNVISLGTDAFRWNKLTNTEWLRRKKSNIIVRIFL